MVRLSKVKMVAFTDSIVQIYFKISIENFQKGLKKKILLYFCALKNKF